MYHRRRQTQRGAGVSVLFSEPKIPQCNVHRCALGLFVLRVSVLFSEPKIPQYNEQFLIRTPALVFQCSSASRKFLNSSIRLKMRKQCLFQCSSASRKFLNMSAVMCNFFASPTFQCSSASRKFLNLVA